MDRVLNNPCHSETLVCARKGTVVAIFCLFTLSACTKSPSGSVEELTKTATPTFSGAVTRSFTTPSTSFVLNGECDRISYGLEYSVNNGSTYIDIPGACPLGTFSINVTVLRLANVYVRSRTKTGFTPSAIATIRFVLPPTSPFYTFVNGGNAGEDAERTTQYGLESIMTADTMTDGSLFRITNSIVDWIYGPYY